MQLGIARKNIFVYLIVVVHITYSNCQRNFFTVYKYEEDEYYCVTNTTFALSWNAENSTQDFQYVSKYVPNGQLYNHSDFKCGPDWQFATRIDEEGIFDRRWETIETHKADVNNYRTLVELDNIQKLGNFNVLLSINGLPEAKIHLCNGSVDIHSYCYHLELPSKHAEKNKYNTNSTWYLTNKKWRHFKLSKVDNHLSFTQLKNETPIVEVNYHKEVYNVTHMIIYSTDSSIWKIHKAKAFHTENTTAELQINNILKGEDGIICLSLFIKMCKSCKLKLTLTDGRGNSLKEIFYASQGKWREIKFIADDIDNKSAILSISTNATVQENSFWLIDENIRQCHKTEYRMIKTKQKANCQLLSNKFFDDIVSLDKEVISDSLVSINNECPAETITNYCVPCLLFLNETCGQLKVCEKYGTHIKCSCSVGWKNGYDPYNCNFHCDEGFYGTNCIKRCGHCSKVSCDHINGTCSPCSEDYVGPKCDIKRPDNNTINSLLQKSPRAHASSNFLLYLIALLAIALIIVSVILWIIYRYVKKMPTTQSNDERTQLSPTENTIRFSPIDSKISQCNSISTISKPVAVTHFQNYVKSGLQSGKFKWQHQAIIDIYSNDYENVKEDFLFNYLDIHNIGVYVVADVPEANEMGTFWEKLWTEKIEHIVLVDGGRQQKILKNYWPEESQVIRCNNIFIHCAVENVFADHKYRKFTVTYKNEIRLIDQLHFTSWRERDKRPLIYVSFFQQVSKMWHSPILVHSRIDLAGTGFVLLCDASIRTAKANGTIDVAGTFQKLIDSSVGLVVTSEDYQLAHLIILEYLLADDVSANLISMDFSVFPSEFGKCAKYLKKTLWLDQYSPKKRQNSIQSSVVTPLYVSYVSFEPFPRETTNLDTLGGNFVGTFECPNKFLVVEQPSSQTLEHFWTLVEKQNVTVILSLNKITSDNFWPTEEDPQMVLSEKFVLEHRRTQKINFYDWIQVRLIQNAFTKDIDIFSITNWTSKDVCPPSVSEFVQFYIETSNRKKTDLILVTCSDGKTVSGLYVAMSHNVERIKKDGQFNFCNAVRIARCQQFLQKEEQLAFLWNALVFYLEQLRLYEI